MPVFLQARRQDGFLTYEPQDFANYSAAIGERGITPPSNPFRVRFPESAACLVDLAKLEQEVAAFFGLGKESQIEYQIVRQ